MDKTGRILELIDNPGKYTPQEIDNMLADPEMREIYETLSAVSSSLHAAETTADAEDIDREWRRFAGKHRRKGLHMLWRQRRAAIISVVVATSLLAVATGIGLTVRNQGTVRPVAAGTTATVAESSEVDPDDSVAVAETFTVAQLPTQVEFGDDTLESILEQIARQHGLKVVYKSDGPKSLRLYYVWDTTQPVEETIASLDNFERFSITLEDNTIIVK